MLNKRANVIIIFKKKKTIAINFDDCLFIVIY